MEGSPVTIARVQELLSVQFTYSKPDDDYLLGICRFDGDWEYDFETSDTWKPEQTTEESLGESGEEDTGATDTWKSSKVGRRIRRKM